MTRRDGQLLLDGLSRLNELEELGKKETAKKIAEKEQTEEKDKKHWDLYNRKNVSNSWRMSIFYKCLLLYSRFVW